MSTAPDTAHLLRIGDLARLTHKTVRAIHLYEEQGLLQPATRSSGGFRLYDRSAVERVRWIDLLHGMGFSLHEMGEVLRSWWRTELGPDAMGTLRQLFGRKLEETRAALKRYEQLERELTQGLAYLETCKECATPDVPVRACAECGQDHGMANEPALVAGITMPAGRTRRGHRGGLVHPGEPEPR